MPMMGMNRAFQFLAAVAPDNAGGRTVRKDHLGAEVPVRTTQGQLKLTGAHGNLMGRRFRTRAGIDKPVSGDSGDRAVLFDANTGINAA